MVVLGEVEGAQPNIDGRVRHSNVADDFRRLPATIESCREVLAMVECLWRKSHFRGDIRRKFWRWSSLSTVAEKLMEKWREICHFDDEQFLYRRNSILIEEVPCILAYHFPQWNACCHPSSLAMHRATNRSSAPTHRSSSELRIPRRRPVLGPTSLQKFHR